MSSLKKLASQTVIYGLSSIVARLLNFLLTPLHTAVLPRTEYGENIDIYSMITFLMVILMFAMETTFFRFYRDNPAQKEKVYSHTTALVIFLSLVSVVLVYFFLEPLAQVLMYEAHPEYIMYMMGIVAIDAITAVPFARLRADQKPVRFVVIRSITTLVIVGFNLLFFVVFPAWQQKGLFTEILQWVYNPQMGVAYIFLANLLGNALLLLIFLPYLFKIRWRFDWPFYGKLLLYASPLVIAGLATKLNEFSNRIFLKYLLPEDGFEQLGIFGANYKIATFMMLFIQAFRYAAEPFFFSGQGNYKEKVKPVMRYFVAVQSLLFALVICFLDLFKHFIDSKYWEGLSVVPILLFANLLLGINFNLNIWYKLENKTKLGAYITFLGLGITLVGNLLLIPPLGYMGAAWATLISTIAMTAYSYYLNQKHSPIRYDLRRIGAHLAVAAAIGFLGFYVFEMELIATVPLFLAFLIYLAWLEGRPFILFIRRVKRGDNK